MSSMMEEEYSEEEIKGNSAPGFTLKKQYDTDIEFGLSTLPLDRVLHARI
jgi:translation elongation factor EF-1beta